MATHQILKAEYVCSVCFQQLQNCTCNHLPTHPIQIDLEIQACVRLLNAKGYVTHYSCSSHLEEYQRYGFSELYVALADWIKIDLDIPKGFTKDQGKNIYRYRYAKHLTNAEFTKIRTEQLNILLDWCKRLPEYTRDVYGRQRAIPLV